MGNFYNIVMYNIVMLLFVTKDKLIREEKKPIVDND